MNDPHVVHLEYRIANKDHIDWSAAKAVVFKGDNFTVEVKDRRVLFRFRTHYGSEDAAKAAIDSYRRNWELAAGLARGPDAFTLRFVRSEIIDRNPAPSDPHTLTVSGTIVGDISFDPNLVLRPARYPEPPAPNMMKRTPDIDSMYHRYLGYRAGREPLPSMAYFCLDMLKGMASQDGETAARVFGISSKFLKEMGRVSSTMGGKMARKRKGLKQPYGPDDMKFLDAAIQRMILRATEVARDPDAKRDQITLNTIRSSG